MYGLPSKSKNSHMQSLHFCTVNNKKTTSNMFHRGINVSYRRRIRQIVVLIFTIIIGILISQATQAEGQAQKNGGDTFLVK
jgi:hypothetical protein